MVLSYLPLLIILGFLGNTLTQYYRFYTLNLNGTNATLPGFFVPADFFVPGDSANPDAFLLKKLNE